MSNPISGYRITFWSIACSVEHKFSGFLSWYKDRVHDKKIVSIYFEAHPYIIQIRAGKKIIHTVILYIVDRICHLNVLSA